jgi:hypothetical protein
VYICINEYSNLGDDMEDMFKNDIFGTIEPQRDTKFNLVGTVLPTNQDFYFVSKWNEIFNRYCSARIFIRKTAEQDWGYWFTPVDNPDSQKAIELIFKSELYETALLNYNILVDLSWTITYVTAEYALYKFDAEGNIVNAKDIYGMLPIEQSYEMLRRTENGVSTPHAEGNPFDYLRVMQPQFNEAIELIINFWRDFANSNIRNLYNYIKHKGKPLYKEIEDMRYGKTMLIKIGDQDYPSDIRDVQRIISLEDGIKELIKFDDNKLFPYIKQLLELLREAVDPSPMAFL